MRVRVRVRVRFRARVRVRVGVLVLCGLQLLRPVEVTHRARHALQVEVRVRVKG